MALKLKLARLRALRSPITFEDQVATAGVRDAHAEPGILVPCKGAGGSTPDHPSILSSRRSSIYIYCSRYMYNVHIYTCKCQYHTVSHCIIGYTIYYTQLSRLHMSILTGAAGQLVGPSCGTDVCKAAVRYQPQHTMWATQDSMQNKFTILGHAFSLFRGLRASTLSLKQAINRSKTPRKTQ